MVDATDSKSVFCEGVRVRVPSPAVWESPGEISEWRFFRDFLYEKSFFVHESAEMFRNGQVFGIVNLLSQFHVARPMAERYNVNAFKGRGMEMSLPKVMFL